MYVFEASVVLQCHCAAHGCLSCFRPEGGHFVFILHCLVPCGDGTLACQTLRYGCDPFWIGNRDFCLAGLVVVKLLVLLVEDGVHHALLDFRAPSHAVGAGHVLDASGGELVLQASWDGSALMLACCSDGLDEMVLGFFFILGCSVVGVVFGLCELVEGGDEIDPGPSRELQTSSFCLMPLCYPFHSR